AGGPRVAEAGKESNNGGAIIEGQVHEKAPPRRGFGSLVEGPYFLFCFSVFLAFVGAGAAAATTGAGATSSTSAAWTFADTITGLGLPCVTTLVPAGSWMSLT